MKSAQETHNHTGHMARPQVAAASWPERTWYGLGRVLVGLYAGLLIGMNAYYLAPIPAGAKILAANHPSTVDPILMTTLVPEQVSVLIKGTIFQMPVVGASLRLAGHIQVVQSNRVGALDEAIRYLRAGRTIGIFPEGGISHQEGGLRHPRSGIARLALSTGAPVIPMGIALDRRRIRRTEISVDGKTEVGTWYLHGPYAVTVGEPMVFDGDVEDREYVRSVAQTIMGRIALLTHEAAGRMPASHTKTRGAVRRIQALWRGPVPST